MLGADAFGSGGDHSMCVGCPALGNQAEVLLAATGISEMSEAAKRLRLSASRICRMFTPPGSIDASFQADASVLDPERRRMELADLAVDVVTAVDYLVTLLDPLAITSSPLNLVGEAAFDGGRSLSDEGAFDRLTRRRLDARGTAVRLGMRLLGSLGGDVAYQPLEASALDRESPRCGVPCLLGNEPPRG